MFTAVLMCFRRMSMYFCASVFECVWSECVVVDSQWGHRMLKRFSLTNKLFHQETEKRGSFCGSEAVREPEHPDTHKSFSTHTHTHNVSLWKHSALLISDRLIRFTLLFEVAVSILCLCLSGSLWRRISRSEVSRRKNHNSQTCPPPVPPPPVQPPPCPSSHVSPASVRQTVHSSVLQSCS